MELASILCDRRDSATWILIVLPLIFIYTSDPTITFDTGGSTEMDTALASRLVKESDHEGKGWILSHAEFRRKKREVSKVKNKKWDP
jgi:hypothetical protein